MGGVDSTLPGTFARVWLAQEAKPNQDEEKVFALKVLRKVDGVLAQGRIITAIRRLLTCNSDPA